MKKLFALFLCYFFYTSVFSQSYFYSENSKKQNGKVDYIYCFNTKNGYSASNCKIYPENIKDSKLYDWRKSLIKIELSDTKFLNAVNSIFPNSYFVVEHCELKQGIKNGPFTMSLCYLKNINGKISIQESQGQLGLIESGEYLNGEYNGVIKSLNLLNKQSNWYLGEVEGYKDERGTSPKWGFLDIEYKNGVIQNQKIFFESDYYYNKIIDENGVTDYTGYYKPWVQFENGKVTKTLTQNDEYHLPEFKIINNDVTTVYSYTLTPKCWNAFSFLNADDHKKNKEKPFVDFGNNFWNKKQLFMEVYTMDNKNLEINRLYKLYYGFKYAPYQTELFKDITDQNIQDTVGCKVAAYYKYENGKRNGVARIFEGNGSVAYKISFKDDLLHGESSHYFNDGKTAFIVNFNNGLPEGEAVSYFNPSTKVPLLSVSVKSEHLIGGVFLPQSIIKWNEEKSIQLMPQLIKDNGGKISQLNSYQMISKVNYQIDSIKSNNGSWERFSHPDSDYSILNNGKPMRKHKIDFNSTYKSKIVDWDYLDQDGKVVYTKAQEDEAKNEQSKKETQEINKKNEEFNNSLQKCVWCSKELAYKNGIASNNTIPCHESNGEKHSIGGVDTLFYCSNACKASYEENQCRKKGYYFGYRKK